MARKRAASTSGHRILLIDDNEEYLTATARMLEREGHAVLTAATAADGLVLAKEHRVDLVLVDYFMPTMTGEDFVVELRKTQRFTQVILQTGYATEQPPRDLLRRLDIQGYHDKSEGPQKLLLWVDVGLRAAYTVQLLDKSRQSLEYILEVTPELQRPQPLQQLLQGILLQLAGLLDVADSFVAVRETAGNEQSSCLFVCEGEALSIRAGTGRYADGSNGFVPEGLPLDAIARSVSSRRATSLETATVVPLSVGDSMLGAVYVDRAVTDARDLRLLEIFANQAATAVQNVRLYEMAAQDPLTECLTRRFFDAAVERELRTAHRYERSIALLLVDLDGMKQINDTWGHLYGDRALAAVGMLLRASVRATDVVGRIGGDEFAVLLPDTTAASLEVVRARIRNGLRELSVSGPAGPICVRASVGAGSFEPGPGTPSKQPHVPIDVRGVMQQIFSHADEDLYLLKRQTLARSRPVQAATEHA